MSLLFASLDGTILIDAFPQILDSRLFFVAEQAGLKLSLTWLHNFEDRFFLRCGSNTFVFQASIETVDVHKHR